MTLRQVEAPYAALQRFSKASGLNIVPTPVASSHKPESEPVYRRAREEMQMKFKPFKDFLPDRTGDVSPPYDVINTAEARELAQGNRIAFICRTTRDRIG